MGSSIANRQLKQIAIMAGMDVASRIARGRPPILQLPLALKF